MAEVINHGRGQGLSSNPPASGRVRTAPAYPGHEGSVGPFESEYGRPHVYARSVHSGSGNCVCGNHLEHRLHTEIAPGVPLAAAPSRAALEALADEWDRRADALAGGEHRATQGRAIGLAKAATELRALLADETGDDGA